MKVQLFRRIIPIFMIILLVACGSDNEPAETPSTESETITEPAGSGELTKIRLPMGFVPDPQYAPFYVADEKGYYQEEGFEVEFDYSFETDGLALVGAGELPFAIVSGEQVILARAQQLPVVYVMEWFQRFPIAVISKSASGIESADDLTGRDVGIPLYQGASYVGYAGLLSANNISLEDVNTSEVGFNQVEALLTDQVEAVVGYANNEPLQLQAMGEEVDVIYVADSADMVANGLIANEEIIENNPGQVEAFVRATLRGLADTLTDPDAAYEISKGYVEGLDESRRNVLESSLDLWRADTLGLSEIDAWRETEKILLQIGFLDEPLDELEKAFTNEFVLSSQP